MTHKEYHTAHISLGEITERGIESGPVSLSKSVFASRHLMWPQHYGAQSRRQRERIDRRYADGRSHGQAKLRIESTRGATHHGDGKEHSHEHERRRDDGRGDALHRIVGGHERRLIPDVKPGLDSLDHNNRVIDHNTNRKHKGEKGEEVDGEADERHDYESTHKRYYDGDGRNYDRLHILQEDEHNEHDKEECLEKGLDNLMHRGVKKIFSTPFGKLADIRAISLSMALMTSVAFEPAV